MLTEQDKAYHLERARAEMNLAQQSRQRNAADAHLRLSALHMGRLKLIDESCDGAGLSGAR